jgi:methylglyoxal synthase
MSNASILMARRKNIALAAHDHRKEELLQWAKNNLNVLRNHSLYATRGTGQLLKHRLGLNVTLLECGPLGGDQQIGSRISEGQIDFVILFSDPLEVQPHDSDVKALLRITVVWNIPVACNRASADFIISSPLMSTGYQRIIPDYSSIIENRGCHRVASGFPQRRTLERGSEKRGLRKKPGRWARRMRSTLTI